MNPYAAAMPNQGFVTKDISALGFQYDVMPSTGRPVSVNPTAWFDRGRIIRQWEPARMLPWNPQSYPSVGREPGMFLPPDLPATPAVQGQGAFNRAGRKSTLGGRTVAAGTATSAPGAVSG